VTIDPDGDGPAPPRDVWCEQDRRGGGWALALKIDGDSSTFAGTSALWHELFLLNGDDLDPHAPGEAKLAPYVDYAAAEVMLVIDDRADIVLPLHATSLLAAMLSGLTISTALQEGEWLTAFGVTSLDSGCHRQGFGLVGDPTPADANGFHIGLVTGPGPGGCRRPSSFLGIGSNVRCPGGKTLAAGAASSILDGAAAQCTPARVLVFVRDDDRTYLGARASCKEHLDAGHKDNGVYLVGNPSVPRRCEMVIDGGGWTSALDLDSVRDSCPSPWQPATSGPHLCINPAPDTATPITIVPPLASYRDVMTSLLAFQMGSTDGFSSAETLDELYLDGLSITTAETPRRHVASYAVGFNDTSGCSSGACACPCLGGTQPPMFIPTDSWRCESGAIDGPPDGTLLADPLFDGAEVPEGANCASHARPEPIRTSLGTTSANLEARLMRDEPEDGSEGLAVYRLELWVR
jgi:hypothetical protein